MKRLLLLLLAFYVPTSNAVVTYANCPTLAPLPVVAFQPGAMVPINNVETAFETGFNVTLRTAIKTADIIRMQAINDSYSAIMKSYIQATTNAGNKDLELKQQMFDLRRNAMSQIEKAKDKAGSSIFPADAVYSGRKEGRKNVNENTFTFLAGMCSMSKMINNSFDQESRQRASTNKSRRNVGVSEKLKQVQSVRSASQQMVDLHYDIFCSEEEFNAGVCGAASVAPKLDINAQNVLYPVGYIDNNAQASGDYRTRFTYNQIEAFAAERFVNNIVGIVPVAPPSSAEIQRPALQSFIGSYKQAQSALSLAADSLQYISALREPVNSSGVVFSQLESVNYLLKQSRDADANISVNTSSDEGRALAIAQQMAFQNQIQYLLYRIEDYELLLDATKVAIDTNSN